MRQRCPARINNPVLPLGKNFEPRVQVKVDIVSGRCAPEKEWNFHRKSCSRNREQRRPSQRVPRRRSGFTRTRFRMLRKFRSHPASRATLSNCRHKSNYMSTYMFAHKALAGGIAPNVVPSRAGAGGATVIHPELISLKPPRNKSPLPYISLGWNRPRSGWRARTRDGVRVLRFSGNKPTAGLSRIRCLYCLPLSCLRAFLKICQTTRRERLFLLSPRFDTKTLSFRTEPKAQ